MNVVGDPSQTTLSDFELLDGLNIGGLLPNQYFKTCCDNLLIHHRTANSSCYFDVYHYFSDVFKNHFKESVDDLLKVFGGSLTKRLEYLIYQYGI